VRGPRLALLALAVLPAALSAQQVRDGLVKPAPGTAVVSGVVLLGETGATPARRARVTLNTSNPLGGHSTIADDEGRFVFAGVQAERFTLSARKDGQLTASYGARRPGGPGVTLVVTAGARLDGLIVRMYRGAAISGRIVDSHGEPLADVRVQTYRVRVIDGERRLEAAGMTATSDDRGIYRVYSLPAGDYIVSATARAPGGEAGMRQVTDREIQAILQRINAQSGGALPSAPARPASATPAPMTVPTPAADTIFAPVYYPGVVTPGEAATLRIAAAEERTGIDFVAQPVRAARIDGVVVDPYGRLNMAAQVTLMSVDPLGIAASRSVSAQLGEGGGRFTLAGVAPGAYTLRVQLRVPVPPANPGATTVPSPVFLWAQSDVTVSGGDVTGVTLVLQPALALAGRVMLERSAGPNRADDLARVRVFLQSAPPPGQPRVSISNVTTTAAADGTFSFPSVVPGRYRLSATYGGPAAQPGAPLPAESWIVTSAMIGDRDAADVPVDIGPAGGLDQIVVRLTDRGGEIAGMLQDAGGRPATDYYVVVFAADPKLRLRGSRRLVSLRPASDGQYAARNLPPGQYLIAAVTDMEASDLADAAFFTQLVPAAVSITLAEGEKKVQHLRLGGR
jgi:protocatechuate 3,4-dioxygenase beta subunit